MCVLIVKPAGIQMPSYSILKQAYKANPHGCGFATKKRFYKTLNFEDFINELNKVRDDEDVMIHFRYATHGSIKKSNCHPFKKHDVVFAHNGILDITPIGDKTDSETAFLQVIYPIVKKYGLFSHETDEAVASVIGYSRFAILQGDNIKLYGDYVKVKGVYYSNLRFLPYSRKFYDIA